MKLEIVDEAHDDLIAGFHFYEKQSPGLGYYFLDSLYSDIDSLLIYGGIHPVVHGSHRGVASRFPFALYDRIKDDTIRVRAVWDCRRRPARIKRWLRQRPD